MQEVWKKIKRSERPGGYRCVKSKWVFKVNRNAVFPALLLSFGYRQAKGIDFNDRIAPVVDEAFLYVLLIVKRNFKF
jgi:hypothetical protein